MLTAKSAVITGSISGIGLAIARALLGTDCDVILMKANGCGAASATSPLGARAWWPRYTNPPMSRLSTA